MPNRIAEAARRAAETLETRAFFQGDRVTRARPIAEAYRQGRISHPNCRCVLDPGDPAGDQTVISVQGPDGRYHRVRPAVTIRMDLPGVAHVPEDAEPLAPPPTWLPRYRAR